MGDKIVVGPELKGLQTNVLPFNVDNDSFPFLLNAYEWRGRIKRKRGTSLLGRLQRFFNSTSSAYTGTTLNPSYTITFDGTGNANLFGPYTNATPVSFSLQANGNVVPGSVTITASVGPVTYTDPTKDGFLTPTGTAGPNTINYATGAIHIPAQAGGTATIVMVYNPDLPVMGLRDFNVSATQFPGTLAFDTVYSYLIQQTSPYSIYDVSFYKNPLAVAPYNYPGYVPKTTVTPLTWNGQDYQQFWTVNYQGALWATNGINVPFNATNVGMQFKPIVTVTVTAGGPPAIVNLQITGHGLVVGDFLFINEVVTTTGINFQSGYVTAVVDANNVTVEFPNATIATNGTGGIAQYLTNRSDPTKDNIRWFDGDPTTGAVIPPVLTGHLGWVNFAPPLSQRIFSISDLSQQQYYLAGARMIVPFKDRLLFIGPVIQTSSANSQVYLQDTVIYSQNGTPYYTASYTNTPNAAVDNPTSPTNVFTPVLTPINQSSTTDAYVASPTAWFEDSTGFGGFIDAGFAQPILTASPNEDVIILGFSNRQARLVYSGNDIVPFNFFVINSELGSGSTFSLINMDRGVLTIGEHGIIETSQISSSRIDLDIPDQVFQFNLTSNGAQRVTAQRDFINEWVYFTYADNEVKFKFPNQTLQYNYRDGTWAIFNEAYTTYGQFRKATGYTWGTIGQIYPTWASWTTPWSAGASTLMQPKVIAGNQQGFVLERDDGTNEGNSLTIQSFTGNQITSPNHCLNEGDYIVISGALGTVGSLVNGKIFSVFNTTTNTFFIKPSIGSGTYFGGGLIKRMYVPFVQTRQFPPAWGMARKTRLGVQQYLLSSTDKGQITLLIFLSQNPIGVSAAASNNGFIVPTPGSVNNSLIYSTVLYTCAESANIGLTPANTNLQMYADPLDGSTQQQQIWHRINTSLIGDTVQLGFTMSDDQMRDPTFSNQFEEIELHSFIIDVTPSSVLA
jgi:hypothetical protein